MELIAFLSQVIVISLSGVLAPGPVTAATLAAGTRSRHAGALVAVGHGIIEFPLMLLIMAGMGWLFASPVATVIIGTIGGAMLIYMGAQMLRMAGRPAGGGAGSADRYVNMSPVRIGIILTIGNPYFLIWWASVGLTLANRAAELGVLAFALFAVLHWLCDFIWLEVLSLGGYAGSWLMGDRVQRIVLGVCGVALLVMGAMFMHDATVKGIHMAFGGMAGD